MRRLLYNNCNFTNAHSRRQIHWKNHCVSNKIEPYSCQNTDVPIDTTFLTPLPVVYALRKMSISPLTQPANCKHNPVPISRTWSKMKARVTDEILGWLETFPYMLSHVTIHTNIMNAKLTLCVCLLRPHAKTAEPI